MTSNRRHIFHAILRIILNLSYWIEHNLFDRPRMADQLKVKLEEHICCLSPTYDQVCASGNISLTSLSLNWGRQRLHGSGTDSLLHTSCSLHMLLLLLHRGSWYHPANVPRPKLGIHNGHHGINDTLIKTTERWVWVFGGLVARQKNNYFLWHLRMIHGPGNFRGKSANIQH